jgi:hypothetical protein
MDTVSGFCAWDTGSPAALSAGALPKHRMLRTAARGRPRCGRWLGKSQRAAQQNATRKRGFLDRGTSADSERRTGRAAWCILSIIRQFFRGHAHRIGPTWLGVDRCSAPCTAIRWYRPVKILAFSEPLTPLMRCSIAWSRRPISWSGRPCSAASKRRRRRSAGSGATLSRHPTLSEPADRRFVVDRRHTCAPPSRPLATLSGPWKDQMTVPDRPADLLDRARGLLEELRRPDQMPADRRAVIDAFETTIEALGRPARSSAKDGGATRRPHQKVMSLVAQLFA